MQLWIDVYHCEKYGGWCINDCPNRNDRKSWTYKIELIEMRLAKHIGSVIKRRNRNEKCNKR